MFDLSIIADGILLEGITDGRFKVSGVAIHPIATYHPKEWPKLRKYIEPYLRQGAPSLAGKPFMLDHVQALPSGNYITKAWWNDVQNGVAFEGYVTEDVANLIKSKKIRGLSAGVNWLHPGGGIVITPEGAIPYAFTFDEASFLTQLTPGDPKAWVKLAEGLNAEENVMVKVNDITLFNLETEREGWLDFDSGIKAIYLRRIDNPEHYDLFAIIFMGVNGWTLQKAQSWITEHQTYFGNKSGLIADGYQSQVSAETKSHNADKAKLAEVLRENKKLEQDKRHIIALFEGLIPSEEILNAWKPGSGAWTLAQEIKNAVKVVKAEVE